MILLLKHYVNYNLLHHRKLNPFRKHPQSQIEKLQARIAEAVAKVKADQGYIEIRDPGIIDYLVSHKSKTAERIKWLKARGIEKGCGGPPFNVKETERIIEKLKTKINQLPKDKPGIIVIYDRSLIIRSFDKPQFYRSLAYQLRDTMRDYNNLTVGIIMTSNLAGKGISGIEQGSDYILTRRLLYKELVQEDILVVKNISSKFPISERLLSVFTEGNNGT